MSDRVGRRRAARGGGLGAWSAAAGLLVAVLGGCATEARLRGPMPVRNQHPAQLTVLHMPPATAEVLKPGVVSGRFDNSYSSLFLGGMGNGNSVAMDGEILRSSLKARIGLGASTQLDLELPVAHTTGGFLDNFVINWHKFWGFPDQNRSAAPRNRFVVQANQGADPVYRMTEESLELLDVPVGLTVGVIEPGAEQPWGLAVRGAVELPTGDEDRGFGNGEPDFSLGVVGEWRGAGIGITGFAQHTFAGNPDRAAALGFSFRDVTSVGGGIELALTEDIAALVQTEVETSTLRGLGFARVADPQWLLWTGGRFRLWRDLHLELSVGEDLSQFIAPDFSIFIGFSWLP